MTASVLVATPHQAFGELLRLSLEEEGRYRVHLVRSAREAAETLEHSGCDIAILDGDLKDMRVSDLGSQMLTRSPSLKVVLIPPDNDPKHASLAGMIYHGYVLRPFYLPDLLDMMETLTHQPAGDPAGEQETAETDQTPASWLEAGLFARALADTSALAGVVLARDEPAVSYGDLPQDVTDELESLVGRALSSGERTDLVRFVRLPGQASDHLFYITPVDGQTSLGLAYPVGTPLSRVRVQAGQVVEAVRSAGPKPPAGVAMRAAVRSWADAVASAPAAAHKEAEPDELDELDELDDEGDGETAGVVNLAELLGTVPPPDPGKDAPANWVPEINMSLPRPQTEGLYPWDEEAGLEHRAGGAVEPKPAVNADAAQPTPAANAPAVASKADTPLKDNPADEARSEDLEATRPVPVAVPAPAGPVDPPAAESPTRGDEADAPSRAKTAPLRSRPMPTSIEEPPVNELEDTKPRVLTNLTNFQQLAPASAGFSLLSYTCVLVPRLPQHHLAGGLSAQAGQWVQQLCVAFGWRLEGIAIRPEYLQWTVQVSPSIAPANLIRILRGRISDLIFEKYPDLAKQNPSGDFWATGYLIVSGMQPPSPRLLRDYIAETRRRQGLSYPEGEPLLKAGGESTRLLDGSQAPLRAY